MQPKKPNKTVHKTYRIGLFFCMFLFFVSLCSGTEYIRDTFGYWSGYCNYEQATCLGTDNPLPVINFTNTYNKGERGQQPIIIDFDGDSLNEIIIVEGTYIYVLVAEPNTGSLILKDSINTIEQQSSVTTNPIFSNSQIALVWNLNYSRYEVAGIFGEFFKTYFMNGTDGRLHISDITNLTAYNLTTPEISGVYCSSEYSGLDGQDTCFFISTNKRMGVYTVQGKVVDSFHINSTIAGFPTNIAVGDIDRDGIYDLVFGFDTASTYPYTCAWNQAYGKLWCKRGSSISEIRSTAIFNAEGASGGDREVYSLSLSATFASTITIYNSDGTLSSCSGLATASVTPAGNMLFGSFRNSSLLQICDVSSQGGNNRILINCWNTVSCTQVYQKQVNVPAYTAYTFQSFGADLNDDGLTDIITRNFVLDAKNNIILWNLTATADRSGLSQGDINNDGALEILQEQAGLFRYYATSQAVNTIPQKVATWGLTPYDKNSICPGTTLQFLADRLGTPILHYIDVPESDTQRLLSRCGNATGLLQNGTFDSSVVILNCNFNVLGINNVRVYLQDAHHKTDFTVYSDYVVNVINGTAGSTCNLEAPTSQEEGTTIPTTTGDGAFDDAETQIGQVFETLTFGSAWLKWLVVLSIIVGTVVSLYLMGVQNVIIINGIIFLEMVMFAVLNMMSWAIVFLYLLVGIMSVVILFILGRSSGTGG